MHTLVPPAIRWLERSQRVTRKITSWIEATASGIFMGLADDSSFQRFDTYPFIDTKPLDLSLEAERGLEAWERRVVREHFADTQSILIVGAGCGRELVALNQLGYDLHGVEYGQELYEATRRELVRRDCRATIQWSERFEVPGSEKSYDAAFVARKFLSHVHGRTRRIEFLGNIRRMLRSNGRLVLGFYTRQHDTLSFRMQAALANTLRRLRGCRDMPVEVGDHIDPDSPLYHHHFVWEEVRDELHEAGFALLEHGTDWFGWVVASPIFADEQPHAAGANNRETPESARSFAEIQ